MITAEDLHKIHDQCTGAKSYLLKDVNQALLRFNEPRDLYFQIVPMILQPKIGNSLISTTKIMAYLIGKPSLNLAKVKELFG